MRSVQVMFPLGASGGGGAGALVYKGTVASASDLPASPSLGWVYVATASFTVSSKNVESGDMLIWNGTGWDIVQGNTEGAVSGPSSSTDGHLAVFDGTSGKLIKDGGAVPDVWSLTSFSYVSGSKMLSITLKRNGANYSGSIDVSASNYFENGWRAGSHNVGSITLSNGSGYMFLSQSTADTLFAQNINMVEFEFEISDKKLCSFLIAKTASSIADSEAGFTTGDQVFDYVSTQIGNIETALASI